MMAKLDNDQDSEESELLWIKKSLLHHLPFSLSSQTTNVLAADSQQYPMRTLPSSITATNTTRKAFSNFRRMSSKKFEAGRVTALKEISALSSISSDNHKNNGNNINATRATFARSNSDNTMQTTLGQHYEPTANDVICGRGRRAWDHQGNARFRCLIEAKMEEYKDAKSKLDKSLMVSQIMEEVEEANPPGRFIKQDERGGAWTTVSLATAREKVGQGFRDLLHAKYRSSSTAKKYRRSHESLGGRVLRGGGLDRARSTTCLSPCNSDSDLSKRTPLRTSASVPSSPSHNSSISLNDDHTLLLDKTLRGQGGGNNSNLKMDNPPRPAISITSLKGPVVNTTAQDETMAASEALVTTPCTGTEDLNLEPIRIDDVFSSVQPQGEHQQQQQEIAMPLSQEQVGRSTMPFSAIPFHPQAQGGLKSFSSSPSSNFRSVRLIPSSSNQRNLPFPAEQTPQVVGNLQQSFPTFAQAMSPTAQLRQQHLERMEQCMDTISPTAMTTSPTHTTIVTASELQQQQQLLEPHPAVSQIFSSRAHPPQQQQQQETPTLSLQAQLEQMQLSSLLANMIPTAPEAMAVPQFGSNVHQPSDLLAQPFPQQQHQRTEQQQQQQQQDAWFLSSQPIRGRQTRNHSLQTGTSETDLDLSENYPDVPWPEQWPFDDDEDFNGPDPFDQETGDSSYGGRRHE